MSLLDVFYMGGRFVGGYDGYMQRVLSFNDFGIFLHSLAQIPTYMIHIAQRII